MVEQIESPMAKNIREATERICAMSQEEFDVFWDKHEAEYVHDPVFEDWITQALKNAKD